jgi:hypothetical protein
MEKEGWLCLTRATGAMKRSPHCENCGKLLTSATLWIIEGRMSCSLACATQLLDDDEVAEMYQEMGSDGAP